MPQQKHQFPPPKRCSCVSLFEKFVYFNCSECNIGRPLHCLRQFVCLAGTCFVCLLCSSGPLATEFRLVSPVFLHYPTAMCFYKLPDLCILTVFDRVPLNELTRNHRLVCTRWNILAKSAMKRRRHLGLSICNRKIEIENDVWISANSVIQLNNFSDLSVQQVVTLFPNVRSLEVLYLNRSTSCENALARLLSTRKWTDNLKILTWVSDTAWDTLVEAINRLFSLKYLGFYCLAPNDAFYEFSIIGHVEEFYYLFPFPQHCPIDWLKRYGEGNAALRRVEMHVFESEIVEYLDFFLGLSPEFAAKFTRIYISIDSSEYLDNSQLAKLCLSFNALKSINLQFDFVEDLFGNIHHFAARVSCLTPLKQLKVVKLNFWFPCTAWNQDNLEGIEQHDPTICTPLKSVHTLELDIFYWYGLKDVPNRLASLQLNCLFPNVKKISICIKPFFPEDLEPQVNQDEEYFDAECVTRLDSATNCWRSMTKLLFNQFKQLPLISGGILE